MVVNLALLALTLVLYGLFRWLQGQLRSPLLNPVLLAIACLVPLLLWLDIPYSRYRQATWLINTFLEPAVVALAYPLYQQLGLIRAQWRALLTTCSIGVILAMSLTLLLATLLGADQQVLMSLAPKAVTTPIAMGVSEKLGGIPALTAVLVILAGIAGAMLGPAILDRLQVTSAQARGLAMGCAAHAVGTARMVDESPQAGAFAGLALTLCGIITATIAPIVVPLLLEWIR